MQDVNSFLAYVLSYGRVYCTAYPESYNNTQAFSEGGNGHARRVVITHAQIILKTYYWSNLDFIGLARGAAQPKLYIRMRSYALH